jgi:hypothetical protein
LKNFVWFRAYSGGIIIFDEKLDLDVLFGSSKFDVLMSMKLLNCEINIWVLSPGVICDKGGIESLRELYTLLTSGFAKRIVWYTWIGKVY